MSTVAANKSIFSERLAYARWVRQLRTRGAESDKQLAELSGLSYVWLSKWKKRPDAPTERLLCRALARYLFVEEDWLLDGEGEPPRPDLWPDWVTAFRKAPVVAPKAATGPNTSVGPIMPVSKFKTKAQREAETKRKRGDRAG